jgi:hypothetical protein
MQPFRSFILGTALAVMVASPISAQTRWETVAHYILPTIAAGPIFYSFVTAPQGLTIIKKFGTSTPNIEIHVLSAGSNYKEFTLHAITDILITNTDKFAFVANWGNEVAVVKKYGLPEEVGTCGQGHTGTCTTEIHILTSQSDYKGYSLQIGTPLPETHSNFEFVYNVIAGGLQCIKKIGTESKKTEVYTLTSGATNYQDLSPPKITALPETGPNFTFVTVPANYPVHVVAIKKRGSPGDGNAGGCVSPGGDHTGSCSTEVHILNADTNYQTFLSQAPTDLPETDDNWEFVMLWDSTLMAIQTSETKSNMVEAWRLIPVY